jgi:hypothetical protein
MVIFVIVIPMNIILNMVRRFALIVGGLHLANFNEDYTLDTTTTFKLITSSLDSYNASFHDCDSYYYDGSYGVGLGYLGSGITSGQYIAMGSDNTVSFEDITDRLAMNLSIKGVLYTQLNQHATHNVFGICTLPDNLHSINVRIVQSSGSDYLMFEMVTLGESAEETWINSFNISSWTQVSGGYLLEVTINLNLMKLNDSYKIQPQLIIHNLADGNTYDWTDLDYITGDSEIYSTWFEDPIHWWMYLRCFTGTTNYLTLMKVTMQ